MPKRTSSYNSWQLEKLSNPENVAAYLNAAIDDSPEMFCKALRNVSQARQMVKVARDAGLSRETLYRATSEIGNPTLETLVSVFKALHLQMRVQSLTASDPLGNISGPMAKHAEPVRKTGRFKMQTSGKVTGISAAAGLQLTLDFPLQKPIQVAFNARTIALQVSANAEPNNLLPAHLCSQLLEREYGYANGYKQLSS